MRQPDMGHPILWKFVQMSGSRIVVSLVRFGHRPSRFLARLLIGDSELAGEHVVEDGCGKEGLQTCHDFCVGAYEDTGGGAGCEYGSDDVLGGLLGGASIASGLFC